MITHRLLSSLAAALLAATSTGHATLVGMNLSPLGDRAGAGVQHAIWDAFTQTQVAPPDGTLYTFDGVAGSGSTLGDLSLSQTSAHAIGVQGSGLLLGGDVYYSSTAAQSWTLRATPSIDVTTISFQIKTANVGSVVDQLFVPTLAGHGAATYFTSAPSGDAPLFGSFPNYVIEYRWTGLNLSAGTPLEITFAMAGGSSGSFTRKPVDFVALDVATVPEPATIALFGLGALVALHRCRRRA